MATEEKRNQTIDRVFRIEEGTPELFATRRNKVLAVLNGQADGDVVRTMNAFRVDGAIAFAAIDGMLFRLEAVSDKLGDNLQTAFPFSWATNAAAVAVKVALTAFAAGAKVSEVAARSGMPVPAVEDLLDKLGDRIDANGTRFALKGSVQDALDHLFPKAAPKAAPKASKV